MNMEGLNWEKVECWRRRFESRIGGDGADIFDIAEAAISVAAMYYPDEFFHRRDTIAQLLFAKRKRNRQQQQHYCYGFSSSSDDDDLTDAVDDEVPMEEPLMGRGRVCGANQIESKDHDDDYIDDEVPMEEPLMGRGRACGANDDDVVLDCTTQTKQPPRRVIKIKINRNKEKQAQEAEQVYVLKSIEESPKKIRTDYYCSKVSDDDDHDCGKQIKQQEEVKKNSREIAGAVITTTTTICREKVHQKAKEPEKVVALNAIAASQKKKSKCNISDAKGKPALCFNQEVAFERKFESTKRKFQQEYKQFESTKKKIRMIDFQDLPPPPLKKNNNNNNKCNKINDGVSKGVEEEKPFELKFEATKTKYEQEYKEIESSRKKIQLIDLKDLPQKRKQQQQKVGFGCRNKYRSKPWQQQQHFRRTIL